MFPSQSLFVFLVGAEGFDVAFEKGDSVFDGEVSEGVVQLGHLVEYW